MKYNKEEAFERLKILKELQRRVFVFNIPKWLSWALRPIISSIQGIKSAAWGFYFSWFKFEMAIILVGYNEIEMNDYILVHEAVGHKSPHKWTWSVFKEEKRAVEIGLTAIKRLYPAFFKNYIKLIEKFQQGKERRPLVWLHSWMHFRNVNLKKLEEA